MNETRDYKVFKIEEGTVIDHIQSPNGLTVFSILGHKKEGIVSIGLNFESKRVGLKDLIKYENKVISKEETDKIALVAPEATINIIKNGKVVEKRPIDVPDRVKGFLKCMNPKCITNIEQIDTDFTVVEKKPVKVMCKYCERVVEVKRDMITKN